MTLGAVGLKILFSIRHPYITLSGIFHPAAVRAQFIIKILVRNVPVPVIVLIIILGGHVVSERAAKHDHQRQGSELHHLFHGLTFCNKFCIRKIVFFTAGLPAPQ